MRLDHEILFRNAVISILLLGTSCILFLFAPRCYATDDTLTPVDDVDAAMDRYSDVFQAYRVISDLHRREQQAIIDLRLFIDAGNEYRLTDPNIAVSRSQRDQVYDLGQFSASFAIPKYAYFENPFFPDSLGDTIYGNLFVVHSGIWLMNWDDLETTNESPKGGEILGYSRSQSMAALEFTSYLSGLTAGVLFNKPFSPVYANRLLSPELLYNAFVYPYIGADSYEGFVSFNLDRFTANTLFTPDKGELDRYSLGLVLWRTVGDLAATFEQNFREETVTYGLGFSEYPVIEDELALTLGLTTIDFERYESNIGLLVENNWDLRANVGFSGNGLIDIGGAVEYRGLGPFALGISYNDGDTVDTFPIRDTVVIYGTSTLSF